MMLKIVEELQPHWTSTHLEGKRIRLTFEMAWFPRPLGITLQEGTETKGSFTLLCRSPTDPHYTRSNYRYYSGESILQSALNIAPESGSPAALDRAKQWLSLCVDEHEMCMTPQPEFRPHRLININDAPYGPSALNLYEPQEPVPYACLSYCWGIDLEGVLRTTTRNALSHYETIDFEELPKTIRDVVTVCKGLNIYNLWVDSICIIQDDLEDWLRESPQMLDIYQNSLVTIYAIGSDSCKSGFLGPQRYGKAQWQRRIKTTVPTVLSWPGTELFVRDRGEEKYRDFEEPMTITTLDRRGCCLQEGILPNRRLYYDGSEMRWECNNRIMCECGHTTKIGLSNNMRPLSGLKKASSTKWDSIWDDYTIEKSEEYKEGSLNYRPMVEWRGIVEDYSSRSLTNPQDKLSAISGIARLMLNATKANKPISEAYYAGLWASSFLTDLAWTALKKPDSGRHTHRRPEQYRAPTWSWESIDGPVRWAYRDRDDLPKYKIVWHALVGEVRCRPWSDADPTGRLKSGYALLNGPLVAVKLEQNHGTSWIYSKDQKWYKVTLELEIESPIMQYSGSDEQDSDDMNLTSRQSFDASSKDYFCFQLFSMEDNTSGTTSNGRTFRREPETWFLVLQRSLVAGTKGTFERIGIGSSSPRDIQESWIGVEDENRYSKETLWKCSLFEGCETKTIKII